MLTRILAALLGWRIGPSVPVRLASRRRSNQVPTCSVRDLHDGRRVIGKEVIVFERDKSLLLSHSPGVNFAYEIPGAWEWGNEPGALRSLDGSSMVGVLLRSEKDLSQYAGQTLLDRAATFSESSLQASFKRPFARTGTFPYKSARFNAMVWHGETVPDEDGQVLRAERIFVEIAPGWLVQATALGYDRDTVLASLIDSFGSSHDRNGYWPLLREHYPELFSENDRG